MLSQVIFTNEEIDMYGEDFLQEAAAKILLLKTEVDRKGTLDLYFYLFMPAVITDILLAVTSD